MTDFQFQAVRHPLPCLGKVSLWLLFVDAARVLVLTSRLDAKPHTIPMSAHLFGGMVDLTNKGHNRVAIEAAGFFDRPLGIWDPKRNKYLEHRTGPFSAPDTLLTAPNSKYYAFRLAECLWAFPHADVYLSFTSANRLKAIRDAKRTLINHYMPDSHHREV